MQVLLDFQHESARIRGAKLKVPLLPFDKRGEAVHKTGPKSSYGPWSPLGELPSPIPPVQPLVQPPCDQLGDEEAGPKSTPPSKGETGNPPLSRNGNRLSTKAMSKRKLAAYTKSKRTQLTLRQTWTLKRFMAQKAAEKYSQEDKAKVQDALNRSVNWEEEEAEMQHRIAMVSIASAPTPNGSVTGYQSNPYRGLFGRG